MRSLFLAGCLFSAALSTSAHAETRVFIITHQPDGYGIDQCLARGESCGAHAARAYCQSRDFAEASSFHGVDPEEVTGSIPKETHSARVSNRDYVAITCSR